MSVRLEDITNRIVSGSATIIAVIALSTAVYQAKLSREQAKASVWPYLIQGNSSNNGYARIVQNVGLGPALIRAFEVRVDGKPVHSWKEMAESLHIALTFRGERSTTFQNGLVLPTGAMVDLPELPDSGDVKLIRAQIERVHTWVCFCSLYGDCWTALDSDDGPEPVKACKDDRARAFRQ